MSSPIPTIREIAKVCGYNNSTVSRALSNKSTIPAATRDRILATAKKMGWKPNPLASAYMAHYRSTRKPKFQASLAYVISFADISRFEELPEFIKMNYAGARARAIALGFTLEAIWLRELDFNFERLKRLLKSRGVPGLILHGGKLPDNAFCKLDLEPFAAATWGFTVVEPRLNRAGYHWHQGIRLTLRKLRALGYRRIALVISETLNHLTDNSLAATFYYDSKNGDPEDTLKSLIFDESQPGAHKKIQTWIERNRPEVVIGTKEVREALAQMDWHIPADIAYVSPHWSSIWPEVGGINQLPEVTGANAVDLVSAQLLRNERGVPASPKLLLNDGCWMDGLSVPANALRSASPALKMTPLQEKLLQSLTLLR